MNKWTRPESVTFDYLLFWLFGCFADAGLALLLALAIKFLLRDIAYFHVVKLSLVLFLIKRFFKFTIRIGEHNEF